MKKRTVAILCALLLLFSVMVPAFAANKAESRNEIDFDQVVSAFRKDISDMTEAGTSIGRLSAGLLRSIGPYLQNVVFTADNMQSLQDLASELMIRAFEKLKEGIKPEQPPTEPTKPTKPTEPTEPTQPTEPSQPTNPTKPTEPATTQGTIDRVKIKLQTLTDMLKKYLFVKIDNPEEAAQLIADDSEIEYDVIEGKGGTYYIRVDIEKYPQVFNYAVFRSVVDDLVEKQNVEMLKDADGNYDYVMTYEHIAGELALHMLIAAAVKGVMKVTDAKSERLLNLYERAAKADLDATESRLPTEMIGILGVVLYNRFLFNTFRALHLI